MIKGSDWGGSKLGTAQTCKRKYYNRFIQPHPDGGTGIIQLDEKLAPSKGTLLHTFWQTYYNSIIKDPSGNREDYAVAAIKVMIDQLDKEFHFAPEVTALLKQELVAAADQYFQKYVTDDIIPIATEVPVEIKYQGHDGTELTHTGIIDLIARWHSGALFIVDHKTTSMSFDMVFRKYTFSLSFKGYIRALEPLYGQPVGVLVNALRFKKNKSFEVELDREPIMYNEAEMSEFEPTVRSIRREIALCENEGFWPKASDQCVQVWGECEYMKLCKCPDPGIMAGMFRGVK